MCGSAREQIEKTSTCSFFAFAASLLANLVALYMQTYESLEQAVWLEHSPRPLVG